MTTNDTQQFIYRNTYSYTAEDASAMFSASKACWYAHEHMWQARGKIKEVEDRRGEDLGDSYGLPISRRLINDAFDLEDINDILNLATTHGGEIEWDCNSYEWDPETPYRLELKDRMNRETTIEEDIESLRKSGKIDVTAEDASAMFDAIRECARALKFALTAYNSLREVEIRRGEYALDSQEMLITDRIVENQLDLYCIIDLIRMAITGEDGIKWDPRIW